MPLNLPRLDRRISVGAIVNIIASVLVGAGALISFVWIVSDKYNAILMGQRTSLGAMGALAYHVRSIDDQMAAASSADTDRAQQLEDLRNQIQLQIAASYNGRAAAIDRKLDDFAKTINASLEANHTFTQQQIDDVQQQIEELRRTNRAFNQEQGAKWSAIESVVSRLGCAINPHDKHACPNRP